MLAGTFLIGGLATLSLPGLAPFVSEFLVLVGTFSRYPVIGIIATLGIVLAALYVLVLYQRTMTGPVKAEVQGMPDLKVRELRGRRPADRAAALPRRLPEAADRHRQPGGAATPCPTCTRTTPSPRWRRPSERDQLSTACGQRRRPRRPIDKIPAPHIEYAQLAPTLIVLGAASSGVLVEAFVPRKGPLPRPGVPLGGRAGRRLRGGGRPRGRRLRHDQGAHRGHGRGRRRRPGALPPGHDPAGLASSPCSPSPSAASTRRRTATRSTPSPRRRPRCRAATARRPRSRPGSPPPRSSRSPCSRSRGMLVFPAANDLLTLFVALEVFSLPLYLLCALARRKRLHVAGGGGQVLPARRVLLRVPALRHRAAVRLRGLRLVRARSPTSSTARCRTSTRRSPAPWATTRCC